MERRGNQESDGGEDAAAREVTQAARGKKFTRVAEIQCDEAREAAAAVGSRQTADELRESQPAIERQPQQDRDREQGMVRKPEEVKQKKKEQETPPMTQKLLEWKAENGKKAGKISKGVASGPSPRSQTQASAAAAAVAVAAKQPVGVGKGCEGVEKEQKKPASSMTSSAAAEAQSPPWLGQLISLELGGIAGTNSARAAVVMNEVLVRCDSFCVDGGLVPQWGFALLGRTLTMRIAFVFS